DETYQRLQLQICRLIVHVVLGPFSLIRFVRWMVSGLPTINPQRWCEAAFQPHCDGIHQVACPELCLKALLSRRDTCIALPQTYI
ncbi:MAG TPA: hypothetical protein VNS63_13790, partial [Blastocatellia bacterium]|nr:hypothetical protein [Blastocatellia bacterium]